MTQSDTNRTARQAAPDSAPEALLCIEVTLSSPSPEFEDAIEGILWDLKPAGVERHDDETFSELVEDPRPRREGTVRWRVYRESAPDDASHVQRHAQAFAGLSCEVDVASWRLEDMSFRTAWMEFFRPTQVSPRVWVHPPWDVPETGSAIRVEIEPGMAFGTGTHETTRLCMGALDELLMGTNAATVLDVGTGSGILAITAAKLGARRVVAIDNDPVAVAVAAENVGRNGVDAVVETSEDLIDTVEGTFDVVVANILPIALIPMMRSLLARVAPQGHLVLSGILRTEEGAMTDAVVRSGAVVEDVRVDGLWCAIVVRCSDTAVVR